MDQYAGNTALYTYIQRYRQPIFLERNLNYLFDSRRSSLHYHSVVKQYSESANQLVASSQGGHGSSQPSHKRRRITKRRKILIDDVCECLLTAAMERENSMALLKNDLSVYAIQPVLKIEVLGIVRLARSLRSHIGSLSTPLRVTNCRCNVQISKAKIESPKRKELLFKSSEICTLVPISANSESSGSPDGKSGKALVAGLSMDEPFYIKASTLSDSGSITLFSPLTNDYLYNIKITLKLLSSHSANTWPFNIDIAMPNRQSKAMTNSPRSSSTSSPKGHSRSSSRNSSASPSTNERSGSKRQSRVRSVSAASPSKSSPSRGTTPVGQRGVPSAMSSLKRRLGIPSYDDNLSVSTSLRALTPTSDSDLVVDMDDADSGLDLLVSETSGVDLYADYTFSPLECPPAGYVAHLKFLKGGVERDAKIGSEIGLEVDMGWSVPSSVHRTHTTKAEEEHEDKKVQEQVASKRTLSPEEDSDGARRQRTRMSDIRKSNRRESSSAARSVTPVSDREVLPAESPKVRYHFALDGKFKTFTLSGFGCPWCDNRDYVTSDRLHFHFVTCHDLFSFRVDMRFPHLMDVYISLTGDFVYERVTAKVPDMRLMQWMRPKRLKFRLSSFLRGDMTWLQRGASLLSMQMPTISSAVGDSQIKGNGGGRVVAGLAQNRGLDDNLKLSLTPASNMYDVDTIPELPKRVRRIFPVPECEVPLYTTKSKRRLEQDEEMSESEDEIDESWLVYKHEETIDDFEDVTENEKKFIKLWDRHIFQERPSSNKHLSDSLLRFCRTNRLILSQKTLLTEFWKHCLNLVDSGIIEPACFYACMKYLQNVGQEGVESLTTVVQV
ncbi:uncharacterized protein V1516DRAFT_133817 [Lipomyces oligophaga]|uniref:uncharacterized protein n=1 Tax=Lipomyces oligophaga TaxID=45792 RepID=UPI0034CDD348